MEEEPSPDGFQIEDSRIPILLALRPTASLKAHEETVPSDLNQLIRNLRDHPYLRHPIIADKQTGLVLDGTHRLAALKVLKCSLVPCALVNYLDPRIKIERWFRIITGTSLESFKARLAERTIREVGRSAAEECLSKRTCYASLEDTKSCLVAPLPKSAPVELSWKAFEIERLARNTGLAVTYSDNKAMPTSRGFVLSTIQLEKGEVVESSMKEILFPPKTTRHIIPSRPLGVSVPIDWLKTKRVEESQRRFKEHLLSKRIKHIPEGSKIGSRRYQEEVFVFE